MWDPLLSVNDRGTAYKLREASLHMRSGVQTVNTDGVPRLGVRYCTLPFLFS